MLLHFYFLFSLIFICFAILPNQNLNFKIPNNDGTVCAGYIFMGEESECTCQQNIIYLQFAQYLSQYVIPNGNNGYGIRQFGDIHFNDSDLFVPFRDIYWLQRDICFWTEYDQNGTQCKYSEKVIIKGETDTIVDLPTAFSLAQKIAAYNIPFYVWDHSINGDQTGLFAALTGYRSGYILRSNTNLAELISVAQKQLIPDFKNLGCGNIAPSPISPSEPYLPNVPGKCANIVPIYSTQMTTPRGSTIRPPPTTPHPHNNSCNSIELIFILDRSQSVDTDFYNNNATQFVLDLATQFTFPNEANPNHFGYARFGVIQFSDDAVASVPLGNYTRAQFTSLVKSSISYTDGGTSRLDNAFLTAYNQFQSYSTINNRAIILLVNDVSMFAINDSIDALHKLENFVTLPMGAIVPGLNGNPQEALSHLIYLLGNRSQLAFSSLTAAKAGIPTLVDTTFPCATPPVCSALIFIVEASEAIGPDAKLNFLKLVQRLVSVTAQNSNQRFAIALYAKSIYHGIELQNFNDFNKTLSSFIDTVASDNFPNGGHTYILPILRQLNATFYTGLQSNYAVLLMAEAERIMDIGPANKIAQAIGTFGADIYVLDQSRYALPGLWNVLTGNLDGHVVNGTANDQNTLFDIFQKSLINEFNAMTC
uniref:VWFA domain-containing protein n=1 Tax=Panagrolaimus superbus TaxID=310955 RepID=A0A914Y387_9BILA